MGWIHNRSVNEEEKAYYSAEFQLNRSKLMYQFKLRTSQTEPLFAIVKKDSKALENLKEGDVINMLYHHSDSNVPVELKPTRIKFIAKDSSIGFKDHYVVGLSLQADEERIVA